MKKILNLLVNILSRQPKFQSGKGPYAGIDAEDGRYYRMGGVK